MDNNATLNDKVMSFLLLDIVMRIIKADPWWRSMSIDEVNEFLSRPLLLRLAVMDRDLYPIVHPLWFIYKDGIFYLEVHRTSKKARLLRGDGRVYFLVDEVVDGRPRGVRGKGNALILDDAELARKIMVEQVIKYLGSADKQLSKRLIDSSKDNVVVKVEPLAFATWIA
ncbi:pyridoxamine 5'-phosphate oxidase family protein [Candidatus Nitrosocaldus cavascurensis]|jgi:nitroimidazol reductase NimA-like FMN-containing flavoprotein (pyridoxamine 5'-phosphate oxidase superfamily)|uniref:Putative FMN-binding pyridoxamine 5'-phosphate oxidase n=2 Tax=Candidatus Nitrosocaldus TaxID=498374 RepID=A0A2K5AS96_9ARCH|nr:pyridoxamine 5'-phosphate oxidase family protein [Candidatus Nitrosocaldus cavascurensis]SPC34520.1 putative FMN-binding pyridoxamine 5'-phosphate oxidase [Candidatus Nitrosocaldus cavascurensis]